MAWLPLTVNVSKLVQWVAIVGLDNMHVLATGWDAVVGQSLVKLSVANANDVDKHRCIC